MNAMEKIEMQIAERMESEKKIARLQSENESLKRELAMLVEVLKEASDVLMSERTQCAHEDDFFHYECPVCAACQNTKQALSATEPQATQWLNDKLSAATEELRRKLAEQQAITKPLNIFYMIEVERTGWLVGRKSGQLAFTNHAEEALTFSDSHSAQIILDDYFGSIASYQHPTTYGRVSVTEHAWCNGPDGKEELTVKLSAAKQEGYEQGKQAGRDEVLLPIAKLWKKLLDEWDSDNYLHQDTCDAITELLLHPSAPIAAAKESKE